MRGLALAIVMLPALAMAQGRGPRVSNVPGVQIQEEGASQGQVQKLNCIGTNVTCAKSGAVGTITVTGGTDLSGEPFITSATSAALSNERVLSNGTNTTVDNGTPGQTKVNLSGTVPQTLGGTGAGSITCAAGEHVTSNGTAYACSADSYTPVALTATVLGSVKGDGVSIACSGTDKIRGWTAAGAMICAPDTSSGNFVEVTADFSTGQPGVAVVVTGQAWVTTSSKITCSIGGGNTTDRTATEEDHIAEGLVVTVGARVAATGFTVYVRPQYGNAVGKYLVWCSGA